jgi:hypothetical protein
MQDIILNSKGSIISRTGPSMIVESLITTRDKVNSLAFDDLSDNPNLCEDYVENTEIQLDSKLGNYYMAKRESKNENRIQLYTGIRETSCSSRSSNKELTEDHEAIFRFYLVVGALKNIASACPNFYNISRGNIVNPKIKRVKSLNCMNLSEFHVVEVPHSNAPEMTLRYAISTITNAKSKFTDAVFYSVYVQIINALVFAYREIEYCHNKLDVDSILLSPKKGVFTVNYDNITVIGLEYIPIITNQHRATCNVVKQDRIFNLGPCHLNTAHYTSCMQDIYSFTADLYLKLRFYSKHIPRSDMETQRMFMNKLRFTETMINFFFLHVPVEDKLKGHIAPFSTPDVFLRYMQKNLDINIIHQGSYSFTNRHISIYKNPKITMAPWSLSQIYIPSKKIFDKLIELVENRSFDTFINSTFGDLYDENFHIPMDELDHYKLNNEVEMRLLASKFSLLETVEKRTLVKHYDSFCIDMAKGALMDLF